LPGASSLSRLAQSWSPKFALFVGIAMVSIAADTANFGDGSVGFGAILQPIAPLVTLAGSIVATAKRRKWPTA
jgi:hypothetical protein